MLSETSDRIEVVENQEQQETEEVAEISTLLRTISISEELQHLYQEDNMEKQRIDSLKVDEFILAEDIADYIDENDVGDSNTKEEMCQRGDQKQKASKLRSELFLGQGVRSSIAHLEEEVFRVDVKVMKDDETATRKYNLPNELHEMDKISKMFRSLLESSNSMVENQIYNIMEIMRSIK